MNKIVLKFSAKSENESLARTVAVAGMLSLNPSIEEINDVKTAVSEAVTNAVVHAYCGEDNDEEKLIEMEIVLNDRDVHIVIRDFGKGIKSVSEAMNPFFTTKSEDERAGMGFTIMRTFMDALEVESSLGEGTLVKMSKHIA